MKALNESASMIVEKLVSMMNGSYVKIDNSELYPAVHIKMFYSDRVLIAHYEQENGHLMAVPEMVFFNYYNTKKWYPIYYKNDLIQVKEESVLFRDGRPFNFLKCQKDHVDYAESWLRHIIEQQELEI